MKNLKQKMKILKQAKGDEMDKQVKYMPYVIHKLIKINDLQEAFNKGKEPDTIIYYYIIQDFTDYSIRLKVNSLIIYHNEFYIVVSSKPCNNTELETNNTIPLKAVELFKVMEGSKNG